MRVYMVLYQTHTHIHRFTFIRAWFVCERETKKKEYPRWEVLPK